MIAKRGLIHRIATKLDCQMGQPVWGTDRSVCVTPLLFGRTHLRQSRRTTLCAFSSPICAQRRCAPLTRAAGPPPPIYFCSGNSYGAVRRRAGRT